jgi:hypothetical protein
VGVGRDGAGMRYVPFITHSNKPPIIHTCQITMSNLTLPNISQIVNHLGFIVFSHVRVKFLTVLLYNRNLFLKILTYPIPQ